MAEDDNWLAYFYSVASHSTSPPEFLPIDHPHWHGESSSVAVVIICTRKESMTSFCIQLAVDGRVEKKFRVMGSISNGLFAEIPNFLFVI